ncbi:hypothetical protein [Paracraurococcus lichenis]|uniref:Type IV secretion system protein VirB2 n=1 Tax=Paracraurococcus lichenis TaxID=3064888 RepID=A0ABT9EAY7_9PROT|nr:hypothetical protein [Paracraurococcus sp. LOR1-02]MDO9713249.1 hypothetical protein [Paracraurococcus sp. LOR1-02]
MSLRTPSVAAALACAVVAGAALMPQPALAQADINAGVTAAYNWAVVVVRAVAAIMVMGAFVMFAVGRFAWWSGAIMLVGILGAAKSSAIAQAIFGS